MPRNVIGFEVAKAGCLHSVALDFKLGLPSGTRTRDLRVSSPALFSTRCDTRRPTEQSHCGSVILVVTELQHCSAIWRNIENAKNSRAKRETHIWSLKWQAKTKKKHWLFTERGLGFQTAGSGTRTQDFRVSSPAIQPLDHAA